MIFNLRCIPTRQLTPLPVRLYRRIRADKLSGSIPDSFRSLEKLKLLDIGGNGLTGPVPPLDFDTIIGECHPSDCCCDLGGNGWSTQDNAFCAPLPPGAANCYCTSSGVKTNGTCAPTPAPTPQPAASMFRCNSTSGTLAHGTCVPDPLSTQTLDECYSSCKCVVPHNCGQLNGTVVCGVLQTSPNVCANCINAAFTQDQCDQCFAYPAPEGCGNKTSTAATAF